MKRIFITSVGGDIQCALLRCLSELKDVELFGSDIKNVIPYQSVYKHYAVAPRYDDLGYCIFIEEFCLKHNITHFIPTTEPEILLSLQNERFFTQHNILVLVNNKRLVSIATSKYKTATVLRQEVGILTPDTFLPAELPHNIRFPLIIKPNFGRGSNNISVVQNNDELQQKLSEIPNPIVQAYIGTKEQEYTVGVFSDGGEVRSIAFRRELGPGGMSVYVQTVNDIKIKDIAVRIANFLGLIGSINLQFRKYRGEYYLFEINPRFSSTIGFRHKLGFKDAIWWLQKMSGEPISAEPFIAENIIGVKVTDEQIIDSNLNANKLGNIAPPPPRKCNKIVIFIVFISVYSSGGTFDE